MHLYTHVFLTMRVYTYHTERERAAEREKEKKKQKDTHTHTHTHAQADTQNLGMLPVRVFREILMATTKLEGRHLKFLVRIIGGKCHDAHARATGLTHGRKGSKGDRGPHYTHTHTHTQQTCFLHGRTACDCASKSQRPLYVTVTEVVDIWQGHTKPLNPNQNRLESCNRSVCRPRRDLDRGRLCYHYRL